MSGTIVISGMPNHEPGLFGDVKFAAGAVTAGSIPLKLLLVGLKTSDGSATADTQVVQLLTEDDAVAYFGARSQLRAMARAAMRTRNIQVYGIAVAEASGGGAVKASLTIQVTSTPTSAGTYAIRLDGQRIAVNLSSGQSASSCATAIAAAINAVSWLPMSASASSDTVTVQAANKGTHGNSYLLFEDFSAAPTGLATTVTGGATVAGGGTFFASGAGTEDVTNVLATIVGSQFDVIAIGQNDATNLALWKTQLATQAAAPSNILQTLVFCSPAAYATALARCQTTMNFARARGLWSLYAESSFAEFAARFGAIKVATEQTDPGAAYDNVELDGLVGTMQPATQATIAAAVDTAAANGVTTVKSDATGTPRIVLEVTTYSLNGTAPDTRCLWGYKARVPDMVFREVATTFTTQIAPQNPVVRDDPGPNDPPPPAGVLTPSTMNAAITGILRRLESGQSGYANPQVQSVSENLPTTVFDATHKRPMSIIPVVPQDRTHQAGVSVRQVG